MDVRVRVGIAGTTGNMPLEPEHLTDLGNARRLVALHGQDLRYVHAWNSWLVWDLARWAEDRTGEVLRRAKETARAIYADAGYEEDEPTRRQLARHALKSESDRALRAMVALAESEPGIPVTPEQLDAEAWKLNVLNGTLDLRTQVLAPHRREDLITQLVAVEYNADATCPTWVAFLTRIMGGNEILIRFLQRAIGYALTGDTSEQAFLIFHGDGSNGKSTFIGTVTRALGDYAMHTPAATLLERDDRGPRDDLARLKGTRLVVAIEADAGRRLSESLVKQLTGCDIVTARRLYGRFFSFAPTFKLVLVSNHRPVIRGTDLAIWRRLRLVPFAVTIPPEEQDRTLPEKLNAELPGILRWAVEGCAAWQREGLGVPPEVAKATTAYRAEQDVLAEFIADRCVLDNTTRVSSKLLYETYLAWCHEVGERPLSRRAFGQHLETRGARPNRTTTERFWTGIGLKNYDASGPMTPADACSSNSPLYLPHQTKDPECVTDASYVTGSDEELPF